jgi:hypothetical protein
MQKRATPTQHFERSIQAINIDCMDYLIIFVKNASAKKAKDSNDCIWPKPAFRL